MGRPVFHEYTLDTLVAASLVIVRVARVEPRERTEAGAVHWPLRVLEVISFNEAPVKAGGIRREDLLPPTRVPTSGEVVEVLINRVNLVDLANRSRSLSGASFPAQRFRSDPQTVTAPEWIAFLSERGGEFEFTAQGAFVPTAELPAVQAAIRLAEVSLPTRRALRKALLDDLGEVPPVR